jgi:hypothetical protein
VLHHAPEHPLAVAVLELDRDLVAGLRALVLEEARLAQEALELVQGGVDALGRGVG